MGVTIKDLRFSIYLNSSEAKKSASDLQASMQQLGDEMKVLSTQHKKDTPEYKEKKKALDELKGKYAELKKESGLYGYSMQDLSKLSKTLRADMNRMIPDSKEWKLARKHLIEVEDRIKSLNAQSNSTHSSLSRMASGFNKYAGIISVGIAGVVGIGMAFMGAMRKAMDFSKSVSELSALTGATGNDLNFMKERAKDLAKEYGKSATEIVTAMKLVGSAKPELLSNVEALSDVTKGVLTLSKATGMDLTEATNNVTTIMNQFGMSAIETDRTVNVLAAGSKYGAKEVDYLGEAISKVGTVAKAANLTLEQTTAAMEVFGEKGIKAEVAGNGFKRILVILQKDTKNYTNGMFDLNKAIENNQKISGDNIALQEKFGLEYFSVAQILLQNKKRYEELTKQVTGTTVAEEQMAIATDNLSGDLDKMTSSWDTFILSLEDGQGPIANTFRKLIQLTKDALDALSNVSKSEAQLDKIRKDKAANERLSVFKKVIANDKDKLGYTNTEIVSEKEIVKSMEKKLKVTQDLVKAEKEKWGTMGNSRTTVVEGEKEIETLKSVIYTTKTYINLLGGLRKSLKMEVAPVVDPNADTNTDTNTDTKIDPNKAKIAKLDNELVEAQNKRKKAHETDKVSEVSYQADMLALQEKYLKDKQALYTAGTKEFNDIEGLLIDMRLKKTADANAALLKVTEDNFKANTKTTDSLAKAEKTKLLNALENKTKTQEQFDNELLALEVTIAERRVADAKTYASELEKVTFASEDAKKTAVETAGAAIISAEEKVALAEKAIADKKLADDKKFADDRKAFRDKFGIDALEGIKAQYDAELKELKAGKNKQWATEKEYNEKVLQLKAKTAVKYAQEAVMFANTAADAISAIHQAETDSLESEKQKQLSAAGDSAEKRAAIEKEFAQKELDLRKKQAGANMAIQIAQAVANGALGIAEIWAKTGVNPIYAGILTALLVGITGAQIASAVAQNATIQGTQLWTGGYTGDGGEREPAGVVHKGEFVANAKAVRNPKVKKFLDVFDMAQKNGTIHLLNTTQILEKVRSTPNNGYQGGGYVQNASGATGAVSNDVAMAILAENARTMARLNAHLDNGIVANAVISGNYGVAKQMERYGKIKSNATR